MSTVITITSAKMKDNHPPEVQEPEPEPEDGYWGSVWRIVVVLMTVTVVMLLCDMMTSLKYSLDVMTSDPEVFRTGSRNVTIPVMFNSFRTVASYLTRFVNWFAVVSPFGR